jgi:hypothetical protein
MTIDDIVLTIKGTAELERLKEDFINRFKHCPEKKVLQSREIKGYSLIFDDEKLPVTGLSEEDEPLVEYSIELSSMQIFLIREFYLRFIVGHHNISDVETNIWDPWYWKLNDFASDSLPDKRHFYEMAVVYRKYLDWLTKFRIERIKNDELALMKVYEGEILKKDNSKLYQRWAFFSKRINRTGAAETKIKNRNKVNLFERVIEKLSGEAKLKAEKDLTQLKINIEDQGFIK